MKKVIYSTNYEATDYDRMFLYLWYELGLEEEPKLGQRFVKAGEDPNVGCSKRAYDSQGQRKDKYVYDQIIGVAIWDFTDAAQKLGMMYDKAHFDDYIRNEYIGHVRYSEVHDLNYIDLKSKVDDVAKKLGQEPPEVKLSTSQFEVLNIVEQWRQEGHMVIAEQLCPRFGKTITSVAQMVVAGVDLVFIAYYVGTVYRSYKNDIMSFKQFLHFEHVEANDPNLEQIIESNLNAGKKTVVYVSMCKSSKRDPRLEYFKSLDCTKGWIIEEADYGVWTEGQAKPLINASKGDFTIVTTGTNMDRATENWNIDKILTVDYLELLVNKRAAEKELEKVA